MLNPRAHPRSRGENAFGRERGASSVGSSPLTRGKPLEGIEGQGHAGLIPAHAGKTIVRSFRSSGGRAHPRSRGENPPVSARGVRYRGSSPLTRGKRIVRDEFAREGGSSPLTRGKRLDDDADIEELGLIPAHAGKTACGSVAVNMTGAHPRSRGENIDHVPCIISYPGSSPLTRGKPEVVAALISVIGLIPAHAGKTCAVVEAGRAGAAHPRSRGENTISSTEPITLGGSSPLTRGKRRHRRR